MRSAEIAATRSVIVEPTYLLAFFSIEKHGENYRRICESYMHLNTFSKVRLVSIVNSNTYFCSFSIVYVFKSADNFSSICTFKTFDLVICVMCVVCSGPLSIALSACYTYIASYAWISNFVVCCNSNDLRGYWQWKTLMKCASRVRRQWKTAYVVKITLTLSLISQCKLERSMRPSNV